MSKPSLEDRMAAWGNRNLSPEELLLHCEAAVAENPRVVKDVWSGKAKALDALVGPAKKREPNIDPVEFKKVCLRLINNMIRDLTLPE